MACRKEAINIERITTDAIRNFLRELDTSDKSNKIKKKYVGIKKQNVR